MRRFVFFTSLFLVSAITLSLLWLMDSRQRHAQVNFTVEGQTIYRMAVGDKQVFVPNGATLSPTLPGLFPSDGSLPYETYLQWFAMMQEMGLNTVRVEALMPGNFYRALRDYNEGRVEPLYLLQGIYFDEVALKDGYLPLDSDWQKAFQREIEAAINAVHGHANLLESIYIFKSKPVDVSSYLLGFTLGVPWGADDIAASNRLKAFEPYEGTYFSVIEGSPFEVFLARMLDAAVTYEVTNYQQQSLYSVFGHSGNLMDALDHGLKLIEPYDVIRRYPVIDAEHIQREAALRSGFFVSYDIETGDLSRAIQYHQYPVVASGYGVPSGRYGAEYAVGQSIAALDETAQADKTLAQYQWLRAQGVAGQFLRDWQDAWFKSSWYSKDLKVLDHSILWRDVQTYGQGYGLLAFDPSAVSGHYPDGNLGEWQLTPPLYQGEDVSLKVGQDYGYLHFLIEKSNIHQTSGLWIIGIDVTPHSGSKEFLPYGVTFERAVDFVAVLDLDDQESPNSSQLYVHSYYDVTRFRLVADTLKRRPDLLQAARHDKTFNPIYQYSDETALLYPFKVLDDNDLRHTGRLNYGNANPASKEYYSEADWFLGADGLELRLPYGLLNVMSPASRMVMGDLYQKTPFTMESVEGFGIEALQLEPLAGTGLYERTWQSKSNTFLWQSWSQPEYVQRTKIIYDQLKQVMKGD